MGRSIHKNVHVSFFSSPMMMGGGAVQHKGWQDGVIWMMGGRLVVQCDVDDVVSFARPRKRFGVRS